MDLLSRLGRYGLAGIVVICMVTAAFLSSQLQTHAAYHQPAFLIYLSTSSLILCLPIRYILTRTHHYTTLSSHDITSTHQHISWFHYTYICGPFMILWLASNYMFTVALPLTDVASSLSLEQSSIIFVYLLSIFCLKELITWIKSISIIICIIGVIILAIGDQQDSNSQGSHPWLGDLLVISSAICAAIYMVMYARYFIQKHTTTTPFTHILLWLGSIGCLCAICTWPILILLHYMKWEEFHWPDDTSTLVILVGAILSSFTFNFLLNIGLLVTSPLFMRLTLILSIPISFVMNGVILSHTSPHWMRWLGACIIMMGFVMFTYITRPVNNTETQTNTETCETNQHIHEDTSIQQEDGILPVDEDPSIPLNTRHDGT